MNTYRPKTWCPRSDSNRHATRTWVSKTHTATITSPGQNHLVWVENFEISTYWLKASYSASELHPHLPFVLLTHYLLYLNGIGGHTTVYRYSYVGLTFTQGLTSAKQMVLGRRIELLFMPWKGTVLTDRRTEHLITLNFLKNKIELYMNWLICQPVCCIKTTCIGVGDRTRTCIKRICNPIPSLSGHTNMVENQGVEPCDLISKVYWLAINCITVLPTLRFLVETVRFELTDPSRSRQFSRLLQ